MSDENGVTEPAKAGTTGKESEGWPPRSRRVSIPGTLVAIDAPTVSDQHWVADAIDITAGGMGLVLPPEVPPDSQVELTFKLGEDLEFARVPATVRHREGLSGGVVFGSWSTSERLKLLEYLVRVYENEES